jgi:LEA14-like dessication related protein
MKHFSIFFFVLFLSSCQNIVKSPEFKGINKISLKQKENGKTVLVANAEFSNPNLVGGKFKVDQIEVYIDNQLAGNLNSETYKVPPKKNFIIPLEIDFNKNFFTKDKKGILDLLDKLAGNKLKVKYQGKLRYVSHGLNIPYDIDYEEDIKIFK